MNRLVQTFGRSRVFLPVIHPISEETALASIQTAVDSDADGIFLINQGMSKDELFTLIPEIRRRYETLWIGINLLGWHPEEVVELIRDLPLGGIWTDNAGIDERLDEQLAGERFREARERTHWDGLYFGGVAFKYQREVPVESLPVAAEKASAWMDVITSSGPGTGFAANVEKVRLLRSGAGSSPIALASGVTPENVDDFLPYVDAYLVASGIETEKYSGILIPEQTRLLSDKIHRWKPEERTEN